MVNINIIKYFLLDPLHKNTLYQKHGALVDFRRFMGTRYMGTPVKLCVSIFLNV